MAMVNFDTYVYSIYCRRYDTTSNAASIHLYNEGSLVGSLYFNYDASIANKDPYLSGSRVIIYYHMSMLDTIIDLLRNERPLHLFHNIPTKLAYISTSMEEVGEEEGDI
jgi:hypothetical protein